MAPKKNNSAKKGSGGGDKKNKGAGNGKSGGDGKRGGGKRGAGVKKPAQVKTKAPKHSWYYEAVESPKQPSSPNLGVRSLRSGNIPVTSQGKDSMKKAKTGRVGKPAPKKPARGKPTKSPPPPPSSSSPASSGLSSPPNSPKPPTPPPSKKLSPPKPSKSPKKPTPPPHKQAPNERRAPSLPTHRVNSQSPSSSKAAPHPRRNSWSGLLGAASLPLDLVKRVWAGLANDAGNDGKPPGDSDAAGGDEDEIDNPDPPPDDDDDDSDPGPEDPVYGDRPKPAHRRIIPQHRKRAPWENADRRIWKTGPDHGSHYPLAWTGWQDDVTYDNPIGIEKNRNACYQLSLLQCLFHLPAFYNMMLFKHRDCEQRDCLMCATQNLLIAYWHGQPRPAYLLDRAPRDADIPDGLTPKTAFGYFRRALQPVLNASIPAIRNEFAPGRQADAQGFWERVLCDEFVQGDMPGHSSPDMFYMTIRSRILCPDCGPYNAPTTSRLGVIQLYNPDNVTRHIEERLYDWARNRQPEACTRCGRSAGRCTGVRKIESYPDVLMIGLPITGKTGEKEVDEKGEPVHTRFHETLELPRRMQPRIDDQGNRSIIRYRLHGSVIHVGDDIGGGHWVAGVLARNTEGYHMINDRYVNRGEQSAGDLNDCLNPRAVKDQRADAKFLLYQRLFPV